jgi:hypothetical protein
MKRFVAVFTLLCVLLLQTAPAQQTQPSSSPNLPTAELKSTGHQESPDALGNPDVLVWVNTKSGIYHCPATHWYTATKAGSCNRKPGRRDSGRLIIGPANRSPFTHLYYSKMLI